MNRNLLNDFEKAFYELYRPLCLYALNYTESYDDSEDIVQQLFADMWERISHQELNISNLKSYLFTAVKNRSLNFCQKEKITLPLVMETHDRTEDNASEEQVLQAKREAKLWDIIDRLPKGQRNIFLMAKQQGMKYQEIADNLHLSVKTVENQMGRALKNLKEKASLIYYFFFGPTLEKTC